MFCRVVAMGESGGFQYLLFCPVKSKGYLPVLTERSKRNMVTICLNNIQNIGARPIDVVIIIVKNLKSSNVTASLKICAAAASLIITNF